MCISGPFLHNRFWRTLSVHSTYPCQVLANDYTFLCSWDLLSRLRMPTDELSPNFPSTSNPNLSSLTHSKFSSTFPPVWLPSKDRSSSQLPHTLYRKSGHHSSPKCTQRWNLRQYTVLRSALSCPTLCLHSRLTHRTQSRCSWLNIIILDSNSVINFSCLRDLHMLCFLPSSSWCSSSWHPHRLQASLSWLCT